MSRKSGRREPARDPDREDVLALEQLLEATRRDPAKVALAQILEWRLARARGEPMTLALDVQFVRPLRVLSTRLVGSNDADDVTQEAFVSLIVWMQDKPVPDLSRLLASKNGVLRLLYRLTVCRAYDHLRRRKARPEDLTPKGEDGEFPIDPAHGSQPHFIAEDIARVERAYAALPPLQRIAHVLHHYYGFTDADFEETFQWNRISSRSHVHRAKVALKRALRTK
jgi:DNA-directed RNA polymerase specialized sigma24 family protein